MHTANIKCNDAGSLILTDRLSAVLNRYIYIYTSSLVLYICIYIISLQDGRAISDIAGIVDITCAVFLHVISNNINHQPNHTVRSISWHASTHSGETA